jgi:hypothetical protein
MLKTMRIRSAAVLALLLGLLGALPWVAAQTTPTAVTRTAESRPPTGLPDDSAMPPFESGVPAAPPALAGTPAMAAPVAADAPALTLWHGAALSVGRRGDPQKWVNVLGNVTSAAPLTALSYTLNSGPALPLAVGPDEMRLARPGDFNIELDYTDLRPGANSVVITATDQTGATTQATVNVNYGGGGVTWSPQTYTYDWATATRVDDLAQVVDGEWALDGDGVRPTVFDFDRLLALGDLSWRDYTVTVPITVFGIDESGYTAPSNGPGVGIMVRWQGHYDAGNDVNPRTGWRRLGGLGWYRWQKQGVNYSEGFQLLGHGGRELGESAKTLSFGVAYNFKLAVATHPDPALPATYRFKVWPASQAEPVAWDIERRGIAGEPTGGSLLLLAHHVDARFGAVRVDLAAVRPRPTLTLLTDGAGGGRVVTNPPGAPRFGEDVVLNPAPDLGSRFVGWAGALEGPANPGVITLFESTTITATFGTGGIGIALPVVLGDQ